MEDDDDLDAVWADTRRPRGPHTPPVAAGPQLPTWLDRFGSAKSTLAAAFQEGVIAVVHVEIALFTPHGEVLAADYARATTTMAIQDRTVTFGVISFKQARSHWGLALTIGICPERRPLGPPEDPAFYLDIPESSLMSPGAQLVLAEMRQPV